MSLLPSSQKEHRLGIKRYRENEMQVGMGLKKVQKQGRDENTRPYILLQKSHFFFVQQKYSNLPVFL